MALVRRRRGCEKRTYGGMVMVVVGFDMATCHGLSSNAQREVGSCIYSPFELSTYLFFCGYTKQKLSRHTLLILQSYPRKSPTRVVSLARNENELHSQPTHL
jgi:hypothetical protein